MPSSADVGTIVTNDAIESFVPDFGTEPFTTAEETLILGVEAEVKRECQRDFVSTSYSDEEYTVPSPILRDGLVIRHSTEFRLKQYPVTTFTSLKKVTARSESTGLASTTDTIQRDTFHVELSTGIVRILKPDMFDPFAIWPGTGFPQGTAILLATYAAGNVPDDLKLLVLQIIARLHLQQKNKLWGRTSQAIDGLQNEYPDIAFTASELRKLQKFKKWLFA